MSTAEKTRERVVNGVNVTKLKETITAIRDEPSLAEFEFRAQNQWITGDHNRIRIQGFYGAGEEDSSRQKPHVLDAGEAAVLLGRDLGPNPVEYVLAALSGCVTTSVAYHAASRNIEIESIQSELDGDIDLRGFLGLDESVTKGYREINVKMKVASDADAEKLRELAEFSPVLDTLRRPVQVNLTIEKS